MERLTIAAASLALIMGATSAANALTDDERRTSVAAIAAAAHSCPAGTVPPSSLIGARDTMARLEGMTKAEARESMERLGALAGAKLKEIGDLPDFCADMALILNSI